MQFKEGMGWKACYDEERSLYTAQYGGMGSYHLYEIDEKHAIALTSGETVNLAENSGGPFSGFSTTAFYCGNCQKVIIDIPRN